MNNEISQADFRQNSTRSSILMRKSGLLVTILLTLLCVLPATSKAAPGVNFTLSLTHGYDLFFPNLNLSAAPAPQTFHRVESPSGLLWRNVGSDNSANPFFYTNNFSFLLNEVTNGLWKVYVNKGSDSEEVYFFAVSAADLSPDTFGTASVLYPQDNSTGVEPNPMFHWVGPSHFSSLNISANDTDYLVSFSEFLPPATTNWQFGGFLLSGENEFYVSYSEYNFSGITFSSPTNSAGVPLSDWNAQCNLSTYVYSFFTVVNSGGGGGGGHVNVGHYEFEDNSVFTADLSPAGNHVNSIARSGGGTNWITTDAISGSYAMEFDNNNGLGGAWLLPDQNLTPSLAGSFTVSLWLKTTQVSGNDDDDGLFGNAGIVSAFNGPTGNWVIPMVLTGSKVAFVTGGFPQHTLHSSANVNDGEFVHIAITRDQVSGVKKIYINGQLDAEGTGSTELFNSPVEVLIGYHNGSGLDGILDDIQFYTGVLNDDEILFLYENPGETVADSTGGSLADAVDAHELTWTTGGDAPWFFQTDETNDGVDAAQSGPIGDDESSWIETTVQGPGKVSFWWRASTDSFFSYDWLEFTINGAYWDEIAGDSGWMYYELELGPGTYDLRWTYYKDFEGSDGLDAVFLDEFNFEPGNGPIITLQPVNQTNYPGYDVALVADASGNPEPSWQWYKVGLGAIPGATNRIFIPTDSGSPSVAGSYYAIASNPSGSANTFTATVTFVTAPLPSDWTRAWKINWLTENDFFYSCVVDPSANLYIVGEFNGTNTFNTNTIIAGNGGSAALLVKADDAGNPIWLRAITNNGSGNSRAFSIAPAPGGVYMSGNFSNANWLGTVPLTSAGEGDVFLIRMDSDGNPVWTKTIGGAANDFTVINCLASDVGGNVYICGLLSGDATFAGVTNVSVTGQQGFLAKFDSAGSLAWVQITSNTFPQYLVHADGVLYTSCENGSSPPFLGGQTITTDRRWVISALTASTGEAIWLRGIGAVKGASNPLATIDDVPRIAVSGTNVFLVGVAYTNSAAFGSITLPLSANRAQYFARYDTDGNAYTASEWGSPTTTPFAAVADANGNVFVSGDFEQTSKFGLLQLAGPANESTSDAIFSQSFVAKFDSDGTPLWARKGQSDFGYANFRGIALAPDGVWAAGYCRDMTRYGTNVVYSNSKCIGTPFCTTFYFNSGVVAKITDAIESPTQPVEIVNLFRTGSLIQFSFQSQSGKTHNVQSRTNLAVGTWQLRSNLTGDGLLKTVQFPLTNATEFFRIETP